MQVTESPTCLNLDQIILATDFTPASAKAMAYARALAKHFSSTLIVSHVIDLSLATRCETAVVGLPIEDMWESGAANLRRSVEELKAVGIDARSQIVQAFTPGTAVVESSKEMNADLIIVGTNARHGLNKWIMGSCAESIIRHAKPPVMTIGPKVKLPEGDTFAPRNILFATDLEADTAVKAATVFAFAEESLGTIYLAHCLEVEEEGLGTVARLRTQTEDALRACIPHSALDWCDPRCLVDFGKPADCILHWAEECNADLIVLGARRSSAWFTPWCDGIVGHVLAESEAPVLTVCAR